MFRKILILAFIYVTIVKSVGVKSAENFHEGKYLNYVDEKVIYLTFDDGPSPNTVDVLRILNEEDVKATFFVIGNQIDAYKDTIKKLQVSGMCILPHTNTHNYRQIYKSSKDYFEDLNICKDKITSVTSKKPVNFVRFPGGVNNELLRNDVLGEIREKFLEDGYYFIEWNVYGLDAEIVPRDSQVIYESTIGQLSNTSRAIVLLHDGYGNRNTVNSLRAIIHKAKGLGFKFKTLEDITEKDFDYFVRKNVINKRG